MFSNISASSKRTANLRSLNLFELLNLKLVIIKILRAERFVKLFNRNRKLASESFECW